MHRIVLYVGDLVLQYDNRRFDPASPLLLPLLRTRSITLCNQRDVILHQGLTHIMDWTGAYLRMYCVPYAYVHDKGTAIFGTLQYDCSSSYVCTRKSTDYCIKNTCTCTEKNTYFFSLFYQINTLYYVKKSVIYCLLMLPPHEWALIRFSNSAPFLLPSPPKFFFPSPSRTASSRRSTRRKKSEKNCAMGKTCQCSSFFPHETTERTSMCWAGVLYE